jgi:hypothetical protein
MQGVDPVQAIAFSGNESGLFAFSLLHNEGTGTHQVVIGVDLKCIPA